MHIHHGAPLMIGRIHGVAALLKKEIPTLFTMHCVIHRENLIAQNLDSNLFDSLDINIECMKQIKRNSLHETRRTPYIPIDKIYIIDESIRQITITLFIINFMNNLT